MLTDFVSPVFFEVVPTLGMASVFATIAKDYANKSQFQKARESVSQKLSAPLGITLEASSSDKVRFVPSQLSEEERVKFGEKVLEIYFAQVLSCEVSILDLRSTSFSQKTIWTPNSIYYRWSPVFREGIQNMYRGFYGDNSEMFLKGLRSLELSHAAEIFKAHFGSGTQESVTFKLGEFKKSFHSIFLSCKEQKTKLHPDFFALGVYLVCLYENLESLNVPLNVRRAFQNAEGIT